MILIQNRQFLPLPLIARCGQLGGQFSKPQVPGKNILHALSFDPSKFQFWAQILYFPMLSKHERCVCEYGISTIAYTHFVHGLPEGKSRTVRDLSKGQSRTLYEVEKDCIGSKINFLYESNGLKWLVY